jgi:hypothetical protein
MPKKPFYCHPEASAAAEDEPAAAGRQSLIPEMLRFFLLPPEDKCVIHLFSGD